MSLNTRPLVSVVVPTHNRAGLVIDALESIFQQTYRPIELIVVDDGSKDDTCERVEKWIDLHRGAADFWGRYIYQENGGANMARNLGIRQSTGEFVAFNDSDDRWLPDKLEKQVPLFFGEWLKRWAYEVHHMSRVSRKALLVKLPTIESINKQSECTF